MCLMDILIHVAYLSEYRIRYNVYSVLYSMHHQICLVMLSNMFLLFSLCLFVWDFFSNVLDSHTIFIGRV
jgi:hypothetical protein